MNTCKKVCNECPFSKSSLRGWLAGYTADELHRIVMSEMHFPCHLTHKDRIPWDMTHKYPRCKGSLIYMKKNCKLPRDKELKRIIDNIPPEERDTILTAPEFFSHHKLT